MEMTLVRRLLAECAGTTVLCLFGIGAAVSVAAAGAGGPGLLIIALAHGLALAVAIYAFGSVSGGHYNPTVTVALAVRGRFPWRDVLGLRGRAARQRHSRCLARSCRLRRHGHRRRSRRHDLCDYIVTRRPAVEVTHRA